MKQVLSLLITFVFLQTQTWAIGGGPQSGASTSSVLNGTYSGALLPLSTVSTSTGVTTTTGQNGLGLFTLALPTTGYGTGQFVYFTEGRTFTGTITGLADPQKLKFVGLLKGQFDIIVSSLTLTDATFGNANLTQTEPGGFANGTISAKFETGGTPIANSNTSFRLKGKAKMEISELIRTTVVDTKGKATTTATVTPTSTLNLIVDGFQQSSTGTATTLTTTGG